MAGGEVRFGGRGASLIGVLGGIGIAIGLPALVLLYGEHLGVAAQVTIIILAVLFGAPLAGVSAVLGIVIPRVASGGGKMRGAMTINVGKDKGKNVKMEMGGGEDQDEQAPSATGGDTTDNN